MDTSVQPGPARRRQHGEPTVWPAVFLDRDGTLIEDRGHLSSPTEVVFFPETVAALRRLQTRFKLFIVTNQAGVAKGALTLDDVERVNAHVLAILRAEGVQITEVYVCPHARGEGCACIKPNRHFADHAAREYQLDLDRSFAVGDHPHDAAFGRQLGGTGLYVLTGHGRHHRAELPAGAIVLDGIADAADWILQHTIQPSPNTP